MVTLGLSKVTRQAAQRWRNPVEDGVLVSCAAKPCQYLVEGQKRYLPPHPSPLPQGERELLPWCNALRLLHPTDCPKRRIRMVAWAQSPEADGDACRG